jgi:3-oxoacyl-[acyl-carrier protein] reductase
MGHHNAPVETGAGKVCFVTGAATGIGAACARRFARDGWNVALNYFPDELAHEARAVESDCRACGVQTLLLPADVRDDAQMLAAVGRIEASWGGIDALINSAGTSRFVPHDDLAALQPADFLAIYEVNVVGTFLATRACADSLRQRSGCVVNLSSLAASTGTGSSLAYAASKGAVNAMTLSLARSLAPQVRVNAIAPGLVDQGLPSRVLAPESYDLVRDRLRLRAPLQRVSTPAEVAALIHVVVAHCPGMTGEVLGMDNGLHLNAG